MARLYMHFDAEIVLQQSPDRVSTLGNEIIRNVGGDQGLKILVQRSIYYAGVSAKLCFAQQGHEKKLRKTVTFSLLETLLYRTLSNQNLSPMKTNLHHGAKGNLFANARQLRRRPTPAEEKLWEHLRNNQMGFKYRRQHPLADYVVKFYCHALKLVVELEDENDRKKDAEKQRDLEALGLTVIRFSNEEVLSHTSQVMKQIYLMQDLLSNKREL